MSTSTASGAVVNLSTLDAVERFVQLHSKCCVYYTAVWCGPCRMIQPVYAELASSAAATASSDNSPIMAFGKIDVDDNPDAAAAAQIRAVPTFVLYQDAQAVHTFSGADVAQLKEAVAKLKEQ